MIKLLPPLNKRLETRLSSGALIAKVVVNPVTFQGAAIARLAGEDIGSFDVEVDKFGYFTIILLEFTNASKVEIGGVEFSKSDSLEELQPFQFFWNNYTKTLTGRV